MLRSATTHATSQIYPDKRLRESCFKYGEYTTELNPWKNETWMTTCHLLSIIQTHTYKLEYQHFYLYSLLVSMSVFFSADKSQNGWTYTGSKIFVGLHISQERIDGLNWKKIDFNFLKSMKRIDKRATNKSEQSTLEA